MEEKIKHYAMMRDNARKLEEAAEVLKQEIEADMKAAGLERMDTPYGLLYPTTSRKWTYPKYVIEGKEMVKRLEKQAQESGEATAEVSTTLAFKSTDLANYME